MLMAFCLNINIDTSINGYFPENITLKSQLFFIYFSFISLSVIYRSKKSLKFPHIHVLSVLFCKIKL